MARRRGHYAPPTLPPPHARQLGKRGCNSLPEFISSPPPSEGCFHNGKRQAPVILTHKRLTILKVISPQLASLSLLQQLKLRPHGDCTPPLREPALTLSGRCATRSLRPASPAPWPPGPLSGEPARTNSVVQRQGPAGTSFFPPSYTVATFRCETFHLSSPSVSPSFSLLRDPARLTGCHRRISRAPSVQDACARVRACARPSGPRAPSPSRSSITWLARRRRRRSRRAGSSVEGARELWRLVTGRSRCRLWSAPSRSRSLLHPCSASRPGPRLRSFSRPGPLRVALRVSARRGRPGGALALRVRADGRRAGCGAWCPRSWAACPAR